MAAELRIALFCCNYNGVRDGANQALNRLARYLIRHGAAVRIYSPTVAEPAFDPAGDLVSVPSLALPGRSEYRLPLRLTPAILADLRAFAPNLIHIAAWNPFGTGALFKLAAEFGAPVAASLHTRFESYLPFYRLGMLRGAVRKRLAAFYWRCDLVLAPNQAIAEELREWGIDRIALWPRGVDCDQFSPSRRSLEWRRRLDYADEEPVLLFLGRLVREKGLAEFGTTVARLRAAGIGVRPLVIGDGPAREPFRKALGDAVFTGYLSGDSLGQAVAGADILLNPSTTEAFGNVNLEAMASGLAVISADMPSARSLIVDDENGVLVPAGDRSGYLRAAWRLMERPLLRHRLGAHAARAAAAHDWNEGLKGVVAAYQRLLSGQPEAASWTRRRP